MTIWCKHVHRLKLQKFFNFCAAHLPVRLDIETKFPYFLFLTWFSIIRNQEVVSISSPTGECASQKLENFSNSCFYNGYFLLVWTCTYTPFSREFSFILVAFVELSDISQDLSTNLYKKGIPMFFHDWEARKLCPDNLYKSLVRRSYGSVWQRHQVSSPSYHEMS